MCWCLAVSERSTDSDKRPPEITRSVDQTTSGLWMTFCAARTALASSLSTALPALLSPLRCLQRCPHSSLPSAVYSAARTALASPLTTALPALLSPHRCLQRCPHSSLPTAVYSAARTPLSPPPSTALPALLSPLRCLQRCRNGLLWSVGHGCCYSISTAI
ncbi:hypothetical protein J6590_076340 [Homalodisca vitripennis]|nr:hypothetical protein J6590_076340 [Homalodisca vitripennis]